jgi:hypothetical protein
MAELPDGVIFTMKSADKGTAVKFEFLQKLVFCRNCKWFEVHPASQLFGWEESYCCNNPRLTDQEGISTKGLNWFCADGERKD